MNNARGSLWRKWDLHFHTPSSFDYQDKSVTNEEIIDVLIDNKIAAVAITDHHYIDVSRYHELRKISNGEVTLFPGIEVRTDYTGSENIHLIGIFPEISNISVIWGKLQALGLHPDEVKEKGDEKVFVRFLEFCEIVNQCNGIVTIHAGSKSSSVENITNSLHHKVALKHELLELYDIFEMGKATDIQEYRTKVLPYIRKSPPMIMCSDNHNIREYQLKENCWIKADPTFRGLLQTLREPDERVYVGEIPPAFKRIIEHPSKYIMTFKIDKTSSSTLDEVWFDSISIPLNPELVAIIGNKGNGKSALSDSIGLSGNSYNYNHFSFLNSSKFCKNRGGNKARCFKAHIVWLSRDKTQEVLLSDSPDENNIELVKYIPQKFFEKLCNEEDEEFQLELERVIFDLVEDKEGKESLDELIDYLSAPEYKEIERIKMRLREKNREISELEKLASGNERSLIKSRLEEKQRELKAIEEPKPVEKPKMDSPESKESLEKIEALQSEISRIQDIRKAKEEERKEYSSYEKIVSKVIRSVQSIKTDVDVSMKELQSELDSLELSDINATDIIKVSYDFDDLNKIDDEIKNALIELSADLNPEEDGSIAHDEMKKKEEMDALKENLDKKNKEFQEYLDKIEEVKRKREAIIGSEEKTGTIKYLERRLGYIDKELLNDIKSKYEKRLSLSEDIYKCKSTICEIKRSLFEPVTLLISENEDLNEDYPITLNVSFRMRNFDDVFLSMINQRVSGKYMGRDEGSRKLREIKDKCMINKKDMFLLFISEVINQLSSIDDKENNRDLHSQILGPPEELYDYVFSLDYLEPYYELKFDNKSLSELSPGERGYLLLVFYLFIDHEGEIPLIIDQPEENLDNQSVYELLVPCIKKVKKRRQVIIVTHNPNIAVVCDAEQIIYANIDKTNLNKVTYTMGSIENPVINQKIVEVLEGTLPAFDKRDIAYGISRNIAQQ